MLWCLGWAQVGGVGLIFAPLHHLDDRLEELLELFLCALLLGRVEDVRKAPEALPNHLGVEQALTQGVAPQRQVVDLDAEGKNRGLPLPQASPETRTEIRRPLPTSW